jgi:hypothetical protein
MTLHRSETYIEMILAMVCIFLIMGGIQVRKWTRKRKTRCWLDALVVFLGFPFFAAVGVILWLIHIGCSSDDELSGG